MKTLCKLFFIGTLILIVFSFCECALSAAPRKTEAELIQMLHSSNYKDVMDAMDRLPNWYPNSTNAIDEIKEILHNKKTLSATNRMYRGARGENRVQMGVQEPPGFLVRKAARSLANYHARLDDDDFNVIYGLLNAPDPDAVMDALKALRGLEAPQAVPKILPLLKHENHNVIRDSCRTLAVLGDTNTIPFIEPLLKDSRLDVQSDAQKAIETLRNKK